MSAVGYVLRARRRCRRLRRSSADGARSRLVVLASRLESVRRDASGRARPQEEIRRGVHGAVAGAVVLAVADGTLGAVWTAPVGVLLGWRFGLALHARGEAARMRRVVAALPALLDRLAMCVLSGMSVERALRTAAPGVGGPLGEALDECLRALDAGLPRAAAYASLAGRAGAPEVAAVTSALTRAEALGTPVAATLLALAREARDRARAAAEAEARTAPVKLVFPLVLCFLPAFMLLAIAPIALAAVRALAGA